MIKLDTSKDNGSSVFPLWKRLAIDSLENAGSVPIGTRKIYLEVNDALQEENSDVSASISRASVINFVSALYDHELIKGVQTSGKGGKRKNYCLKSDKSHFDQLVAFRLLKGLSDAYPAVNLTSMIGDL